LIEDGQIKLYSLYFTAAYPYRTRRSQKRNQSFYLPMNGKGEKEGKCKEKYQNIIYIGTAKLLQQ